jgi:hypothetical protein
VGQYCAAGPNSNTFIGTIVRRCLPSMVGPGDVIDPGLGRDTLDGDWVPAWTDNQPQAGTFGPWLPKVGTAGAVTQKVYCPREDCTP